MSKYISSGCFWGIVIDYFGKYKERKHGKLTPAFNYNKPFKTDAESKIVAIPGQHKIIIYTYTNSGPIERVSYTHSVTLS
jgi:hypothetical protein